MADKLGLRLVLASLVALAPASGCGGPAENFGQPLLPPPGGVGATSGGLETTAAGPRPPALLSYATSPALYSIFAPIPPNVPSVAGVVAGYAVSPALPAGLILDPLSGVISGTPSAPGVSVHTVTASNPGGSTSVDLSISIPEQAFFEDPHQAGLGRGLKLVDARWGRLVEVWDRDPASGVESLRQRDLVIGASIQSDGLDFLLETSPVTLAERLTILHAAGSARYQAALALAEGSLEPIAPKGVGPGELPPFSMVPRNAAVALRFSDLLDEHTIDAETVRVLVGVPPALPFSARILADPNHGGGFASGGTAIFATTRVIVDPTVSALESLAGGAALPIDLLGFPPSESSSVANAVVRIPTAISPATGQFELLASASGKSVALAASGPSDPLSPTLDVVRAFRSGGPTALLGDPDNGFLPDNQAPRLLGELPVQILAIAADPAAGADHYLLDLSFGWVSCALAPEPGDALQLAGAILEVTQPGAAPVGGAVGGVQVRLLAGDPVLLAPGSGAFLAPYEPSDADVPACFVRFSPDPTEPPARGVSPSALLRVRFSEPLDPSSVQALEDLLIATQPVPALPSHYAIGELSASTDLTGFTLSPSVPLSHVAGAKETWHALLSDGPADLAGNPLADAPPPIAFRLDAAAPTLLTGGIALRFGSLDEDGNGKPEIRGQFLHDLAQGLILPRPVARFSAVIDRHQPMVAAMPPLFTGVQTPLVPLGSKLMSVWRYPDMGFDSSDESFFNLDVERLAWAPVGGAVLADVYPQFQISLAHAGRQPDEALDPISLLPEWPNSGLVATSFAANPLSDPDGAIAVVHPKAQGYLVDPLKKFVAATGTPMMPWPLNQGADPSAYVFHVWRDTAVQGTGAPQGAGIDLDQMLDLDLSPAAGAVAAAGSVPSIGLPLLMEFRCYPSAALGLNAFDVSIALNSSSRPSFRAFSSGGVNGLGQPVVKDPDLELVPSGGFSSVPPIGPTPPTDNVFYLGQVDFVVRVSRAHSIWFDSGSAEPDYAPPIAVPTSGEQPPGSSVTLAFRGATAVAPGSVPAGDASGLDAYGDQPADGLAPYYDPPSAKNPSVSFPAPGGQPDRSWKADVDQIDGLRHFQVRLSFVGNATTGKGASLSALGIGFTKP